MTALLHSADIHARINWPAILAQLGMGEEHLRGKRKPGPCPVCGGRDRFFFSNFRGRGDWHCRHCEPHAGDGFDLLMRVTGADFATVRMQVMQAAGLADQDAPIIRPSNALDDQRPVPTRDPSSAYRPWHKLAAHLWEQSLPLAGSLAEQYLLGRGCAFPPSDADLRFLPARGSHSAAMLGRVTDIVTAEPISLHFTYLNPDGTKQGRRLLAGHRKQGGCIRLWPDDCVATGLALAEGIENALSAAHVFAPIWATVDAGNMAAFPVLNGIESLTLFADHDEAGIAAARTCAARWADADREAFVAMPTTAGADLNDVVAA